MFKTVDANTYYKNKKNWTNPNNQLSISPNIFQQIEDQTPITTLLSRFVPCSRIRTNDYPRKSLEYSFHSAFHFPRLQSHEFF